MSLLETAVYCVHSLECRFCWPFVEVVHPVGCTPTSEADRLCKPISHCAVCARSVFIKHVMFVDTVLVKVHTYVVIECVVSWRCKVFYIQILT